MKLIEIIGLETKHAKLLEKAGIKEVEDLLSLSYYQIKQMARSIGVNYLKKIILPFLRKYLH